jgi:hypothetical protein
MTSRKESVTMANQPPSKGQNYEKKKPSRVRVSSDKVVFSLSPDDMEKMGRCLEKGEIRLTFKEVRATRLPHILDDGVIID